MIPISVCIIAKNEEKYIGECLRRLSDYDWEIIVVDTGSTDNTVNIAHSYTPNVYHFDWINDFSAAKNYAVSKATNDYILTVDCDEYLEAEPKTEQVLRHLPEQVQPHQIGIIKLLNPSASSKTETTLIHDHVARFFNKKYAHYEGAIHEQLIATDNSALTFIPLSLTFYHNGYSSIEIKRKKTLRNIPMLKAELQKKKNDPYLLFQLGQSYFGIADFEQALPYFETALSLDLNEHEDYVQTMVESYGYCLLYLKQYSRALELEGIYPIFSKRADFVFLMGLIYMNNALLEDAISEFTKATTISNHAADGVNSYCAYYNIGVIYECLGKTDIAVQYYNHCGDYEPAIQRIRDINT